MLPFCLRISWTRACLINQFPSSDFKNMLLFFLRRAKTTCSPLLFDHAKWNDSRKTTGPPNSELLTKRDKKNRTDVSQPHKRKGFINQQNKRETLVSSGIHFAGGCCFYSLFLQLNAWATGSLATVSAMMQDWRGTDLQFHSAGEDESVKVCSSKPLKVMVNRESTSHLTGWKSADVFIKLQTGFITRIQTSFVLFDTQSGLR